MKQHLSRRWFLYALVLVLAIGTWFGPQLAWIAGVRSVRDGIVAAVLFLMALPLRAGTMWRAMWPPWAPLLAVMVNFGLLPLFAWGVASGMHGFSPAMADGLLVAAATPCTLASATVWTRRAGGNDSVATLVTILTNVSCFVVTPLWLVTMIGKLPNISVGDMIGKLGLLVVLPMAFAQLLRVSSSVAEFASHRRIQLGVLAQCGILAMIFLGAIQTGVRLSSTDGSAPLLLDWLLMIGAVLLVHLTMLWSGFGIARGVGIVREDAIGVAFSGSQKTLMVGLQVAMECQITILPMVAYHIGQLFVDTLIADRFRSQSPGGDG